MATNYIAGPYLRDCDTNTQYTTPAPWSRWIKCMPGPQSDFWGSVGGTQTPDVCTAPGDYPCIAHLFRCQ
jgi:hypothetical protein